MRPEFAAWRYGESYRRRRHRNIVIGGAGVATLLAGAVALGAGVAGAAAVGGGGLFGFEATWLAWKSIKFRQMRCRVADPERPGRALRLGWMELEQAALLLEDGAMAVEIPRSAMVWNGEVQRLRWEGRDMWSVGSRVTGKLNLLTGSTRQLEYAVGLLSDQQGDLEPWIRKMSGERADWRRRFSGPLAKDPRTLAFTYDRGVRRVHMNALPGGDRLALEMWLNEDIERIWLEGELKLLEREWREAEELAKFSDNLQHEGPGERVDE
jgi:hypothetical protein